MGTTRGMGDFKREGVNKDPKSYDGAAMCMPISNRKHHQSMQWMQGTQQNGCVVYQPPNPTDLHMCPRLGVLGEENCTRGTSCSFVGRGGWVTESPDHQPIDRHRPEAMVPPLGQTILEKYCAPPPTVGRAGSQPAYGLGEFVCPHVLLKPLPRGGWLGKVTSLPRES